MTSNLGSQLTITSGSLHTLWLSPLIFWPGLSFGIVAILAELISSYTSL